MGDSVKKESMVTVHCMTRDGMTVRLPEDVAAVINLCGLCLYFGKTFCDVEMKRVGEVYGDMITSFNCGAKDFDWVEPLVEWVRDGMPKREDRK
ncbi:hypothetical protein D3C87_1017270 [compost metagenome]